MTTGRINQVDIADTNERARASGARTAANCSRRDKRCTWPDLRRATKPPHAHASRRRALLTGEAGTAGTQLARKHNRHEDPAYTSRGAVASSTKLSLLLAPHACCELTAQSRDSRHTVSPHNEWRSTGRRIEQNDPPRRRTSNIGTRAPSRGVRGKSRPPRPQAASLAPGWSRAPERPPCTEWLRVGVSAGNRAAAPADPSQWSRGGRAHPSRGRARVGASQSVCGKSRPPRPQARPARPGVVARTRATAVHGSARVGWSAGNRGRGARRPVAWAPGWPRRAAGRSRRRVARNRSPLLRGVRKGGCRHALAVSEYLREIEAAAPADTPRSPRGGRAHPSRGRARSGCESGCPRNRSRGARRPVATVPGWSRAPEPRPRTGRRESECLREIEAAEPADPSRWSRGGRAHPSRGRAGRRESW